MATPWVRFGVALEAPRGNRAWAALIALAWFPLGCDSKGTTGERVEFATRATVDDEIETEFVTAVGWRVKLEQAAVAFDSFYYFNGEPAFVRNDAPPADPFERIMGFLGEGVAHAHPGHYLAGDALGEMLVPGSIDLFGGSVSLGAGRGVTGPYRSARFTLADHPVGAAKDKLGGHVAIAEGTAQRDEDAGATVVHFRLSADFADVAKSVTNGEVDGCEFEPADVLGDGTVTVTIKPSVWFNLVNFSDVAPGTAEEPTTVAHGDIAQVAFALGLVQLTAYRFAFQPILQTEEP